MALAAGTRLGAYEIVALLGAGGMGEVYRARDTNLGRDVAIKVLPDAFATDIERIARFQREAKTLASLNHPHIAAIYGLEESNGIKALVLELVEGPTLADRIAQGAIPIDEALPIAKQTAEALEAAHEQGIVHRDLKPANITLRPDGTVKVLDFGLAKAVEPVSSATNVSQSPTITTPAMTQAGVILGTAAYMSPEQAKGRVADKRSDIWAFGCVLYEMLTGKRAFEGEDVSDTLASVLRAEPEWSALSPATPPAIRRLLRRCLEKDRRRRLDSAADARLEIEEAALAHTDLARAAEPVRTGRREAVAWGLAVLAITAAAGVAVWQISTRPAVGPVVASQFVVPSPEGLVYRDVPAISPDGRTIAFVATERDGRLRLWLRSLDVVSARPLPGTDGAVRPFWSPDSRAIAFFVRGQLKRIDVNGASPQLVADNTSLSPRTVSGSWSRNGDILYAAPGGLMRVSAAGGTASRVMYPGATYPWFLPDGQHFFFRLPPGSQDTGIYVGALDSPDKKLVAEADSAGVYAAPGYLLFSRGGVLMAQPFDPVSLVATGDAMTLADKLQDGFVARQVVSAAENGTLLYGWNNAVYTRLEWVDRRGTPSALAADPGTYTNVALSPDDSRVAFDRGVEGGGSPDVWLLDLARHVTSRFTFGPNVDNVAVWSPDGRTVAFASADDKLRLNIARRPANAGGPAEVLLKLEAPPIMFPSDWSADGRFLAYYRSHLETKLDLWVLALADGKAAPLLNSQFNESQGQFSPDGKWLAYVSDESGTPQVYVQSFPTLSGKWQVSPGGGSQPRWRRDGKELFYLAADLNLMVVAVKSADVFDADAPRALFQTALPYDAPRQSYSVSVDGQRFLLNNPVETASSSFNIILNWTGWLKR